MPEKSEQVKEKPKKTTDVNHEREDAEQKETDMDRALDIAGGLAKLSREYHLGRLEVGHNGLRVMVSRESDEAEFTGAMQEESPAELGINIITVNSPLTGVFYCAPLPGAPPFVDVGDTVEPGTVLCIIEAMKLMNEITSEVSGKITKIVAENGQVVEENQVMFHIDIS
ncbi:MAG: acetyl-CoA carboxylase, biotin carboxyl carrier protein [Chloroflexi bacterium]|nr:acetyl-CoA carboxylase, biotin carboxyl carrier protein [Chloroflexota bacterium]